MTIEKAMTNVTNFITQVGPHLLPPAAVLFAVLGLLDKGLGFGQVAALTFVLVLFSGLLSEALGKIVDINNHEEPNKARRNLLISLGASLAVIEVILLHEGMVWAFKGLISGYLVWATSVLFTALNVFAKYTFIDKPTEEEELPANVVALEKAAQNMG